MEHGKRSTYVVHKCRCDACREANRIAQKESEQRKREGRSLFVDAEPVRQRWLWLRSQGMSNNEIERAAGLDHKVSHDLLNGHWRTGKPLKRINRKTAEAVFSVRTRAVKGGMLIPADKMREYVLDLMEQGYSVAWIAREIGVLRSNFNPLHRDTVRASTYAKVKRLWERTTTPAPTDTHRERLVASRARNTAAKYRHVPDVTVKVDVERIMRAVGDRPLEQVNEDAGLSSGHIHHIISRGACRLKTLGRLASALGVDETRLIA